MFRNIGRPDCRRVAPNVAVRLRANLTRNGGEVLEEVIALLENGLLRVTSNAIAHWCFLP